MAVNHLLPIARAKASEKAKAKRDTVLEVRSIGRLTGLDHNSIVYPGRAMVCQWDTVTEYHVVPGTSRNVQVHYHS